MSTPMPLSPSGCTPSAIQDPSPAYSISTATVEFRSLYTDNYEPASTFFALVDTIDDLTDENEEPPFVCRRSATPDNVVVPFQPVTVDVGAVQQLFSLSEQDEIAEALELYQYDTKLSFWVLTAGPLKIIVGNDSGHGMYKAWLGPEAGFSTITLAYDPVDSDPSSTGHSTALKVFNSSEDGEPKKTNVASNNNHTATQDQLGIRIRRFGTEVNERATSFYQLSATMNASLDPTQKLECVGHKQSMIMFHLQGRMIVKPIVDRIKNLFHVSPNQIASELILYEYGEKYAFWTIRIGEKTVIMKGKGGHFCAWLGPTQQLSSPLVTSKGLNPRVTPQSGRKSNAAQIAENQGSEGIFSQQDGTAEHKVSASWLQKRRAVDLESDDDSDSDVTTVHCDSTRKKMKLLNETQTVVSHPARGLSAGGSTAEKIGGEDSVEKRSTSNHPLPDADGSLDKLARTKLYVSISTNNYGAVPIKMSSCRTIDAFFASVLTAWDLEEREEDVAAVVVRVDRDGAHDRQIVIKKKVPDSFEEMLEMIEGASCWNEGGKQSFRVDVEIKIAQA